MATDNLILNLTVGFQLFTTAVQTATLALQKFNEQLRVWLLLERGGEWPDKFTLLNRYVRTGIEPEYFSDERWAA